MKLKKVPKESRLNLVPMMDAIFIFIFFLLMSAEFVKYFSIMAHVPKVGNGDGDSKIIPLELKIKVESNLISIFTGVPSKKTQEFPLYKNAKLNLVELSDSLNDFKKNYPLEKNVTFYPESKLKYHEIVSLMDVFIFRENKNVAKDSKEKRIELFPNVIFGNLNSTN